MFWQSVFNISERALLYIIRFLKYFLFQLSINCKNEQIQKYSEEIPQTVLTILKLLGINDNEVTEYVVCPKCFSVYEYEDCIVAHINGTKHSKFCCYVKYPLHPQPSQRKLCELHSIEKCL